MSFNYDSPEEGSAAEADGGAIVEVEVLRDDAAHGACVGPVHGLGRRPRPRVGRQWQVHPSAGIQSRQLITVEMQCFSYKHKTVVQMLSY